MINNISKSELDYILRNLIIKVKFHKEFDKRQCIYKIKNCEKEVQ